jgi:hypothetical protein
MTMRSDRDDFADVGGTGAAGGGIFGNDQAALQPGHQKHHSVATNLEPDGLHMHFDCRTCGKPRHLIATYPELLSCFFGVPPQATFGPQIGVWTHSPDKGWVPVIKCPSCPDNLQPGLSPREIKTGLEYARQAGWLPPQIEQQVNQRVMQLRGGG